ncbi:aldehyde dehydrogenase family protein [Microbacterium binotii]|uniref:aldehyde dehydrogenase family protein n=1 Tax=Microbacterium binotii TaxID=462710 RepID=UPI001F157A11|nr:aldehyde dehydrogenase family protein [Microbacterium binotii]UIN30867.1 aldehyde dehydrogenase family protein [Microbacterium binotii]
MAHPKESAVPASESSATPTPVSAPELDPRLRAAIADDLVALRQGAALWSRSSIAERIRALSATRDAVGAAAADWAGVAARAKGLSPDHPLRGEEWLSGPYAVLGALDGYLATLRRIAAGGSPLDGVRLDRAPGDRIRAHVFPREPIDNLLLSGFTGEIWLRPGTDASSAIRRAGLAQVSPGTAGVGLVLGAGNISAIPVLDVLYELLAFDRVSLLKVNPTQDDLVPVFERALAPLIGRGLVRIVRGGGDVGAYLTAHEGIEHVHITGSAATFDAIVWGDRDRTTDEPRLRTPITAELGGVSPIIVVPGEWTDADLRFQAAHIATMRLHNSGHNCIAGQVVLLSADWPQREQFLRALHEAYRSAPARPVWYPRADERLHALEATYPSAEWSAGHSRALVQVAPGEDAAELETTEYFAPVLGVVELPGTGQDFLDAAVAHANTSLAGTLGANVIVDPDAEDAMGAGFERAIADLRYGGIAINAWTGVLFATPVLSWGAFPGSDVREVGSGIGVVHNTSLLADVERSVLRGPFRPFPRSLGAGRFSVLPTPPWFVSARTAAAVSEGLTRYRVDRNPLGLALTLIRAMGA